MKYILIISILFLIPFVSSFEVCINGFGICNPELPQLNPDTTTTSSTNSSTLNVNNSQFLQGLNPQQVANLYNNTLLNQNCPSGYVVNGTYSNGTLKCTAGAGFNNTNLFYINNSYNISVRQNFTNISVSDRLNIGRFGDYFRVPQAGYINLYTSQTTDPAFGVENPNNHAQGMILGYRGTSNAFFQYGSSFDRLRVEQNGGSLGNIQAYNGKFGNNELVRAGDNVFPSSPYADDDGGIRVGGIYASFPAGIFTESGGNIISMATNSHHFVDNNPSYPGVDFQLDARGLYGRFKIYTYQPTTLEELNPFSIDEKNLVNIGSGTRKGYGDSPQQATLFVRGNDVEDAGSDDFVTSIFQVGGGSYGQQADLTQWRNFAGQVMTFIDKGMNLNFQSNNNMGINWVGSGAYIRQNGGLFISSGGGGANIYMMDNVNFYSDLNPVTDNSYDLGTDSQKWKILYVNNISSNVITTRTLNVNGTSRLNTTIFLGNISAPNICYSNGSNCLGENATLLHNETLDRITGNVTFINNVTIQNNLTVVGDHSEFGNTSAGLNRDSTASLQVSKANAKIRIDALNANNYVDMQASSSSGIALFTTGYSTWQYNLAGTIERGFRITTPANNIVKMQAAASSASGNGEQLILAGGDTAGVTATYTAGNLSIQGGNATGNSSRVGFVDFRDAWTGVSFINLDSILDIITFNNLSNITLNSKTIIKGDLNQTNGNATINNYYGEMWNKSDTGFTTIDLVTQDVYVPLAGLESGDNNGVNIQGKSNMTILVSGLYNINAKVGVQASTTQGEVGMKVFVNGTGYDKCYDHEHTSTSQPIGFIINCNVRINAGSNITIRFDDHMNPVSDLSILNANVNVLRIAD